MQSRRPSPHATAAASWASALQTLELSDNRLLLAGSVQLGKWLSGGQANSKGRGKKGKAAAAASAAASAASAAASRRSNVARHSLASASYELSDGSRAVTNSAHCAAATAAASLT